MTRRSPPPARAVAAATVAVFLAVFALLVFQLRSGRDPALGQGTTLAKAPVPPPKRILVRKTIVTRVIVHLPAEEEDDPAARHVRHRGVHGEEVGSYGGLDRRHEVLPAHLDQGRALHVA